MGKLNTIFKSLLDVIEPNPERAGLEETPKRMSKAWLEWTSGYQIEPADLLKTFEDGAEGYDEMVIVRDIDFYSMCEHHLAPFFGTVSIAYIPDKRIVGLSKFARLTDAFAKRLQVQERLTTQIAEAISEVLQPKGVAVRCVARHMCMESRGIQKRGSETVTNCLLGAFKNDQASRAEFFRNLNR